MLLSFTGADDSTNVSEMFHATRYINSLGFETEWGVLFHPEKEGWPRTPGYRKRMEICSSLPAAAHLCGKFLFDTLKQSGWQYSWYGKRLLAELKNYERIQVNINARRREYETEDVLRIYEALFDNLDRNQSIIMQWHEDAVSDIELAVNGNTSIRIARRRRNIHFLIDGSRGKGKTPEKWNTVSDDVKAGYSHYQTLQDKPVVMMAGGLSAQNVVEQIARFTADTGDAPAGVDLESSLRYKPFGERTGDLFSVNACVSIAASIKAGETTLAKRTDWLPIYDPYHHQRKTDNHEN